MNRTPMSFEIIPTCISKKGIPHMIETCSIRSNCLIQYKFNIPMVTSKKDLDLADSFQYHIY